MTAPQTLQFRDGADGTRVDLATMIASRVVIQGSSGAGKSYLLRWMLEQTHGQIQHLFIDPECGFATLRERFDYVVASAGEGGDVPADPRTAKLLARQLVELGASAILDLYELDPDDRALFVGRFLRELISLPKEMWRPLLVVLDEAHEFAPQVAGDGPPSLGPVRLLASKGRKRGFGAVFATQRVSKLHKDVADAGNFLIGYTGLDVDVLRAGDMLGMDKATRQALKRLDPGQFYAFGPAISRDVQLVRSGTVQTTHPKPGDVAPPTPPAPAKIRALLEQLHDIPERAAEEEAEVERLRSENARLQRELRAAAAGAPAIDADAVRKAREEGLAEGERRAGARYTDLAHRVNQRELLIEDSLQTIRTEIARIDAGPVVPETHAAVLASMTRPPEKAGSSFRAEKGTTPAGPLDLKPRHLKILEAITRLEAIGLAQPDRSIVATLADTSPTSSGYDKSLGQLNGAGLIRYPAPGTVEITDGGRRVLGAEMTKPATLAEVHRGWYAILPPQHQRILQVVAAHHPDAVTRDELAAESNNSPTSSGYDKALGRLRSLGLIDYPERGLVEATKLLMPEGLR